MRTASRGGSGRGTARAAGRCGAAAAARRRPGRRVSLGRTGLVGRHGARAELHEGAAADLLDDVRGRGVRRECVPATTRRAISGPSTRRSWRAATRSGDAFPRTVWHAETPLVRTAATPMMLLADSVRAAGYKVVLTGEGADEAFGGYDLFKEAKIRRWVARFPRLALAGEAAGAPVSLPRQFARRRQRDDAALLQQRPRSCRCARLRAHAAHRGDAPDAATASATSGATRALAWDPAAALAAGLPDDFGRWRAAGARSVRRGAHAAERLPAVVAGRPRGDGRLGRGALSLPRSSGHRVLLPLAAATEAARAARESAAQEVDGGRDSLPPSSGAPSSPIARPTAPASSTTVSRFPTWPTC